MSGSQLCLGEGSGKPEDGLQKREPGCMRTAVTRGLDTVLAATLGTRTELPLPRGSERGSDLPRSHCQEVAKL